MANHEPIDVYEMPSGGQVELLDQIDAEAATLAMRVCAGCAPEWVLVDIDNGELDLTATEAIDAQWPCAHVTEGI